MDTELSQSSKTDITLARRCLDLDKCKRADNHKEYALFSSGTRCLDVLSVFMLENDDDSANCFFRSKF